MGECCSKTNNDIIQQHKMKVNTKNDHYFISVPYYNRNLQFESLPLLNLEEILRKIEIEKENFSKRLAASNTINEFIPEINIEVEKGINLVNNSGKNSFFPFVKVNLEPNGVSFNTNHSESDLPD